MTTKKFSHICLIVPTFNPQENLVPLMETLSQMGFEHIIMVNDGSPEECAPVFTRLASSVSTLVHHDRNQGKGAALKTAFEIALRESDCKHVITLDADGQHLPEDVRAIAETVNDHTEVILGVRRFGSKTPLRSKLGNALTRWVFWKLCGTKISDTQTGLRLIPLSALPDLVKISSDRYEYEMEMLAYFVKTGVRIEEVEIQTVYIDNNKASHFRPLIDSAKIYYVLLKDAAVSLSSFGLDITAFALIYAWTSHLLTASLVARAISATYNFLGHKYFVFGAKQKQAAIAQILQYGVLMLLLISGSYWGVRLLTERTAINPTLAKVIVDSSLYVCSFLARRFLIFRPLR